MKLYVAWSEHDFDIKFFSDKEWSVERSQDFISFTKIDTPSQTELFDLDQVWAIEGSGDISYKCLCS